MSVFSNSTKRTSPQSMRQVAGGLALSLCLSLLAVGKAVAAEFSYIKIADTQSDFSDVVGGAAINDKDTIAFFATPTSGNQGIYTASNGAITQIVNVNALPSLLNPSNPASNPLFVPNLLDINNNDTVAFLATGTLTSGPPVPVYSGLFTIRDGSITTRSVLFISDVARENIKVLGFSLNDKDELAYLTVNSFRGAGTSSLNISRPNQPDLLVATASTPNPPIGSFFSFGNYNTNNQIAINNQSQVTFAAAVVTDNTSYPVQPQEFSQGIFRGDGGEVTTLIDSVNTGTLADVNNLFSSLALGTNDNGDVVFSNNDTLSLYNNSSGTVTTIADGSSGFNTFGNTAINNNGTVAFAATLDTGASGIFIGSNSSPDKVIATGDRLLDSTVTKLIFTRSGLNNLNQVVFYAELANGNRGIFRADLVR